MEPRQQTPSVIARLMGLDELPPKQPIHKKQRVLSEEYLQKTASIGSRGNRSFQEIQSSTIKTEKQHNFKDTLKVSDISMMDKDHIHSIAKRKLISSKTEVKTPFIRQKFKDAKYFSVDEELCCLNEFNEVLDDLESKKDALLRYLQEPDHLFTRDLHDVQGVLYFHSDHLPVLKSSNDPNNRDNEIYGRLEKTPAQVSVVRSLWQYENGSVADSCTELRKLSKSQMEWKDEAFVSSRIVVLKPNFGKTQYTARSSFFPKSCGSSQSGDKNYMDISRPKKGQSHNELAERTKLANHMEPSRPSCRLLRGTTKDSVQIRQSAISSSLEVSKSEFRVHDAFEKEAMPFYRKFVDLKNQSRTSFSSSNGSYLAREAKKQLFERWKTTRRFDKGRAGTRGFTLGEMLAMPDRGMRSSNLSYKPDENGLCHQLRLNEENEDLCCPLAISSEDDCKDEFAKNTGPKTNTVSCVSNRNPRSRTKIEASPEDWCFRHEDVVAGKTNKLRKKNNFEKDGSKSCNLLFGYKNRHPYPFMNLEDGIDMQETHLTREELERKVEKKDSCQGNPLVSNLLSCSFPCSDSRCNRLGQGTQLPVETSSKISEEQEPGPRAYISLVKNGHLSSHPFDSSNEEELFIGYSEEGLIPSEPAKIEPVFPLSLGETYQRSQNSVLQPPFQEENLSGFQGSETTNDHLPGLGIQFQLLKSDSEDTHSEGSGMVVSSDEDTEEGSFDLSEENRKLMGLFRAEESRDFSYLVDVLDEAGFHGGNLEIGFETWYLSKCPLSFSLFEALEKKYGEQTSWKKSERRILFDRINAGIMEIVKPFTDIYLWKKPLSKRFCITLKRDVAEEELWMLLKKQEKEANKDLSEKALGIESRWLELGEEISSICRDIEEFLFCELVAELDSIQSL